MAFRPITLRPLCKSSYGSDCGCGCKGPCGCDSYGYLKYGGLAYGGLQHRAIYRAVRTVPSITLAGGPPTAYGSGWFFGRTFENYNPNNKWYRKCSEYRAACDDFATFRQKVLSVYGTRLKDQTCGGRSSCKSDPYLTSAESADRRLLGLQAKARSVLSACKRAEEGFEKGDQDTVSTSLVDQQSQVSNTPPPAESSPLPIVPIAIGGVALIGLLGAAVIIKKRRKAAKLAAQAGV